MIVFIKLFLHVVVAACPQGIVCRQGKSINPMSMALKLCDHTALVSVPYFYCSVLRACVNQVIASPNDLGY